MIMLAGFTNGPAVHAYFTVCCYFFSFMLGSVVGSGVLCLVVRKMHGEPWVKGRSHCDACGHQLNWIDLLPIFGFLIRKGRCHYCGVPIPGDCIASELIFGMAGIIIMQGATIKAIPTSFRAAIFLIGFGCMAGYIALLVNKEKYRKDHKRK